MRRALPAGAAALLALLAISGLVALNRQGQVPARLQGRVEMIGGGAGQGRWQDLSVLDEEHGTDLSLQDHESMLEGDGSTQMLYQIGDQEYLAPSQGGVEDMALEVERALSKEQVLLKKIDKRAKKHQRVSIDVVAGQIGKRGPPGPMGYEGEQGFQGERGARGPQGYRGPTGPVGPEGIKGVEGNDGKQGLTGPVGSRGATGPAGPQGRKGREGGRGEEGPIGPNGEPGKPGKMGRMGPPGPPAEGAGARGPTGPPGPVGPPGINGNPGRSGGEGNRGPNGMDGSPGRRGAQGLLGREGKSQCGLGTNLGKRLCYGELAPTAFKPFAWDLLYADVDTAKCAYKGVPKYFTTLTGASDHWNIWTVNDITTSDADADGTPQRNTFRIYIKTGGSLSESSVRNQQWSLKWFGVGDSTNIPNEYKAMCCGSQSSGWEKYSNGLTIPIDTKGCGWQDTAAGQTGGLALDPPFYFTELSDSTCQENVFTSESSRCVSTARGSGSIYSSSMTSFRIYVKSEPGKQDLDLDRAIKNGWKVSWCALKTDHPTPAAGFPCTAPRLLAGSTSSDAQAVVSNNGKICCDTTDSTWSPGGANFLRKEIDITQCGFTGPPTTVLTNLIGKRDIAREAGGVGSYSTTNDVNKIVVHAWTGAVYGNFDKGKASQANWKIEWCAMGR